MTPEQEAARKRCLDSAFQQIAAYQVASALHDAKPDLKDFEKTLGGAAVGCFTQARDQWDDCVRWMARAFLDRDVDFDVSAFVGACNEAGYA
jgi:hypothetical protein